MLGLGLGTVDPAIPGKRKGGPPPVVYEPEAEALFARFTTPPTTARKGHIDTLWKALKAVPGLVAKGRVLWLAGADAQATNRNWLADQYNLTESGTLSFIADKGFAGDGTTGKRDTGFALNLLGQNDLSAYVWSLTDLNATQYDFGQSNTNNFFLNGNQSNNVSARVNSGTLSNGTTTNSLGFYGYTRNGVNTGRIDKNGAKITGADVITTSATIGAGTGVFHATATSFGTRRLAFGWIGQHLTETEMAALYNAVRTYLTAIGALVNTVDVAAWGDSLTQGSGASANNKAYPAVAGTLFTPARLVSNQGIGGQTSTQIKTRFINEPGFWGYSQWLWLGRNNYSDKDIVKADIAECISKLSHNRYLVGSIINGDYAGEELGGGKYVAIENLNAELAALYGPRFVNVKDALMAAAIPGTDDEWVAKDIPPLSLRNDQVHLKDNGYAIVAQAFKAAHLAMGW